MKHWMIAASCLCALLTTAQRGFADEDDERAESCRMPGGVAPLPGFSVSVFARGTASMSNPDSLVVDGDDVWVGYQNVTATDGSDGKTSTIVEYDRHGRIERTFSVPEHNDGLRIDPAASRTSKCPRQIKRRLPALSP